ncbi:MAG: hypothetical protein H0S85_04675 [Desulfovibrionaceae bacterium]|jgi:glutamate racemase|nr:hypothetical protein [Desulfovibrionaceae bacterium]
MKTIAVMGGTRFDTGIGCRLVESLGARALPVPIMGAPSEQNAMQYARPATLHAAVQDHCAELVGQGVGSLLLFCNSLSVSIDTDRLALGSGLRVVTPLTALPALAGRWDRFLVLGANAKSVAGIEKILYGLREDVRVQSYASLAMVELIESGAAPAEVWERSGGDALLELARRGGAECLVLGCTHLTAIADFLAGISPVPVADTGRMAAELLLDRTPG